jgi:CheY-like chemotaxis protein
MKLPFSTAPEPSTYSAFFRAVNNEIMQVGGAAHEGPRQILCECSRRNCAKTLTVTASDYRAIRAEPAHYIVAPGHELGRVQRVVSRTGGLFVVRESELCLEARPLDRITPIVLVADDEPAIRELCTTYLRKSGLVVFEAPDGQIALEQARSLSPDLVITDVSMPVVDGFRLAEAMRRDDRTASIPLIFLSGNDDARSETRALELGALAYFSKPFDPPALASVVTGVLARFTHDGARPVVTPIRRAQPLSLAADPTTPAA